MSIISLYALCPHDTYRTCKSADISKDHETARSSALSGLFVWVTAIRCNEKLLKQRKNYYNATF